MDLAKARNTVILIPIYNDWESASLLLPLLDAELAAAGRPAEALLVDDGSLSAPSLTWTEPARALQRVRTLRLRRNLGHQRAIAVGLTWLHENMPGANVVVMDGDGEDQPADVPRLLARLDELKGERVVFAERTRRSESTSFRLFYRAYCGLHRLLTGIRVRVGNFSAVPPAALDRLVVVAELWNHYAAAVVRARVPFTMLPTQRGRRLAGESRMNFVSLVTHGLSAISVFAEILGVRLLVAGMALAGLAGLALLLLLAMLFIHPASVPGWLPALVALLILLLPILLLLLTIFVFIVLSGRQSLSFLPLRDYRFFVAGCETLRSS